MILADSFMVTFHFIQALLNNWGFKTKTLGSMQFEDYLAFHDRLNYDSGYTQFILDNTFSEDQELFVIKEKGVIYFQQSPFINDKDLKGDDFWEEILPFKNIQTKIPLSSLAPSALQGCKGGIGLSASQANNIVFNSKGSGIEDTVLEVYQRVRFGTYELGNVRELTSLGLAQTIKSQYNKLRRDNDNYLTFSFSSPLKHIFGSTYACNASNVYFNNMKVNDELKIIISEATTLRRNVGIDIINQYGIDNIKN